MKRILKDHLRFESPVPTLYFVRSICTRRTKGRGVEKGIENSEFFMAVWDASQWPLATGVTERVPFPGRTFVRLYFRMALPLYLRNVPSFKLPFSHCLHLQCNHHI